MKMNSKRLIAGIFVFLFVLSSFVSAAEVDDKNIFQKIWDYLFSIEEEPLLAPGGPIIELQTTNQDKATLGYPRWKMHMTSNGNIWVLNSDDRDQLFLSTDYGVNWDGFADNYGFPYGGNLNYAGQVRYSIDYHASLSGDSLGNLFVTYPVASDHSVRYRKVVFPSNLSDHITPASDVFPDKNDWTVASHATNNIRSNVVVTNTEVFIITRVDNDAAENVKYYVRTSMKLLRSNKFI